MSEKTTKIIIDEIKSLSIDLSREGHYLTRRELVERINLKFPHLFLKESLSINTLVVSAFEECSYSTTLQNSISNSFYANDGKTKIFDPNRIGLVPISLTLDCNNAAFESVGYLFSKMNTVLLEVEKIDYFLSIREFEEELKGIKLVDVFSLTGASKVEEKSVEAKKIFDNYRGLIDKYSAIKEELSNIFVDFEQLRNALKYMREDVALMLIEVFGENYKLTNPNLFDFTSVRWMETDVLLHKLDVEFQKIEQKSQIFFEQNEEAFNQFGNSAINRLKQINGSRGSISNAALDIGVEAVFSIVKSREESKKTIVMLDHDIELMKHSFHTDVKAIQIDVMRLLEIFKNVKENFTPTLQTFTLKFKDVFDNKLKKDFYQIFSVLGIKEIKDENSILLNRIKHLDIEIHDVKEIINSADLWRLHYLDKFNAIQSDNNYFVANEPIKPSTLTSICSFGIANLIFPKMHQQWNIKTLQTRLDYKKYLDLLKLEIIRVEFYTAQAKKYQDEQDECRKKVKVNAAKIFAKLENESAIKNNIASNLTEMIALSKLSKEVLETKLEDRLLTAV